jgi:2-oxoglutarate dehydrogenase E2 component (dihydrolipoamide succinyltransferase)
MIDVTVPEEQEGTKAVVRTWLKRVGDSVAENEPLVELETDKVTQEVPAPAAGVLTEILIETDAEAVPGAVLGRISTDSTPARAEPVEAPSSFVPEKENQSFDKLRTNGSFETRLSPAVRQALEQHRIDPATITGTGENGRITRDDVDRAVAEGKPPSGSHIPLDRMRQRIAENMVRAVSEAPHVTAVFEADFSAVAAHKAAMAERGMKLSYTAYILKAAAEAMAAAPQINGRWDGDRIAVSPTIDIGVGTALGDKGLVVPVVRDVASLSLEEVGTRLDERTRKARDGELTSADVAGGSFTISNHGVSGSLLAAPIILHNGQAAILGNRKIQKREDLRENAGQD